MKRRRLACLKRARPDWGRNTPQRSQSMPRFRIPPFLLNEGSKNGNGGRETQIVDLGVHERQIVLRIAGLCTKSEATNPGRNGSIRIRTESFICIASFLLRRFFSSTRIGGDGAARNPSRCFLLVQLQEVRLESWMRMPVGGDGPMKAVLSASFDTI